MRARLMASSRSSPSRCQSQRQKGFPQSEPSGSIYKEEGRSSALSPFVVPTEKRWTATAFAGCVLADHPTILTPHQKKKRKKEKHQERIRMFSTHVFVHLNSNTNAPKHEMVQTMNGVRTFCHDGAQNISQQHTRRMHSAMCRFVNREQEVQMGARKSREP